MLSASGNCPIFRDLLGRDTETAGTPGRPPWSGSRLQLPSGGDVVEQVPCRPRGRVLSAHPDRTEVASQVQVRDGNGAQAAVREVIADGQPAHHSRTGTGQNGSANRCGRSEFEWVSGA